MHRSLFKVPAYNSDNRAGLCVSKLGLMPCAGKLKSYNGQTPRIKPTMTPYMPWALKSLTCLISSVQIGIIYHPLERRHQRSVSSKYPHLPGHQSFSECDACSCLDLARFCKLGNEIGCGHVCLLSCDGVAACRRFERV